MNYNINKQNSIRFVAFKFLVVFLTALLFMSTVAPIKANAYNDDYLDRVKWENNSNISSISFIRESIAGSASINFNYAIDSNEYAFYVYINVSEDSITEDAHEVSVGFQITNEDEQYNFSVDSDGETDYLGNDNLYFNVASNFNSYPATHSGDYIVAIDINNGYDDNLVSISLNINGRIYSVAQDLYVPAPKESDYSETTTGKNKTTVKNTKQKSTSKSTKDAKTSTAKSTTEKSTKFYNNKVFTTQNASSYSDNSSNTDEQTATTKPIIAVEQNAFSKSNTRLTTSSKIILSVAVALGVTGIILILLSSLLKDKKTKGREENDAENEDNDCDEFDF